MGNRAGRSQRRNARRYVGIPHEVFDSRVYVELKSSSKRLLLELCRQYNGYNNGDLCVAPTLMKPRGWTSRSLLREALGELLARDCITQTRKGGRNATSLYALTWEPIDECKDKRGRHKLDVQPTTTAPTPLSTWRHL